MSKCPSCFIQEAQETLSFGILPCVACQARQDRLFSPQESIEIIPERIKQERQERGDSIEQPHLKGQLNKRWVDLWGQQAAKERGFTDKEIKNAEYVYDGIRTKNTAARYYKDRT